MPTLIVNKYHNVPYDIYIGRGSKWSNPYSQMKNTLAEFLVKNREEAIEKYEEYLLSNKVLLKELPELFDKTLGCFCKPKSCHGDILVKYANIIQENNIS